MSVGLNTILNLTADGGSSSWLNQRWSSQVPVVVGTIRTVVGTVVNSLRSVVELRLRNKNWRNVDNCGGLGGRSLRLADITALFGAVLVHPFGVGIAFAFLGPAFAFFVILSSGFVVLVGAAGLGGRAHISIVKASFAARLHAVGNHPIFVGNTLRFLGIKFNSIPGFNILGGPFFAGVGVVARIGDAEVFAFFGRALTVFQSVFTGADRAARRLAVGNHPFKIFDTFAGLEPSRAVVIVVCLAVLLFLGALFQGFFLFGFVCSFLFICFFLVSSSNFFCFEARNVFGATRTWRFLSHSVFTCFGSTFGRSNTSSARFDVSCISIGNCLEFTFSSNAGEQESSENEFLEHLNKISL